MIDSKQNCRLSKMTTDESGEEFWFVAVGSSRLGQSAGRISSQKWNVEWVIGDTIGGGGKWTMAMQTSREMESKPAPEGVRSQNR